MKKPIRIFFSISLFLLVASFATCHFGVKYTIGQIPPEVRNQMADTDWIGDEWIALGILLMLFAIVSAVITVSIWFFQKHKTSDNLPAA